MKNLFVIVVLVISFIVGSVGAWHDQTHLSVAKAAGYKAWYNAASPDVFKTQQYSLGFEDREGLNHYYNGSDFTADEVTRQVVRFGSSPFKGNDGCLLGAVVVKVREYKRAQASKKYGDYHLAFVAHYVADLAMPFHVTAYDAFNKKNHVSADGVVESLGVDAIASKLTVVPVVIVSEDDLVAAINQLAIQSHSLADVLRTEQRIMSESETISRLSAATSLYAGILEYVKQ